MQVVKIPENAKKTDFEISINPLDVGQGKPVDFINIALASNPNSALLAKLPVMDTFGINTTYGGTTLPTPSFSLKMDRIIIDRERCIAALKEESPETSDDAEPHPCLVYMKVNPDKSGSPGSDDYIQAHQQLNLYNFLLAIRESVVDWFMEPMEVEDRRNKGAMRVTTRAVALLKKQDLTTRMAIRGYFMSSIVSKYDTVGNASDNIMEGKYGPNIKINIKPVKKYVNKTLVSTTPITVYRGFGANAVPELIRVEDKAYAGCRIRPIVRVRALMAPKGPVIGLDLVEFQYVNRPSKRQIHWDDDDLTSADREASEQEAKRMKTEPVVEAIATDSAEESNDGYGGYGAAAAAAAADIGLDDML